MLHVLMVQLPVPNNTATNIPLAAGYLKAYAAARGLDDRVAIEILPRDLADTAGDAALAAAIIVRAPHVLGLSLYTWNCERSLALASRVREHLPGLLVVGGGPEVQPDNEWVLRHPGLDLAVVGEGEQTFAELLDVIDGWRSSPGAVRASTGAGQGPLNADLMLRLAAVAGLIFRDDTGGLVLTPERAALPELGVVPSPYLRGDLELRPGDMLMVEVSRWCPYACSFCLYGRNMGPRLGGRYFPLERLLDEIRWGRARGATRVHFIEANLNLVPPFQPLMQALADLNADGDLALYAELRGEHLSEGAADALARAGLRVAEVGLQTANLDALRVAHRRTDLAKWAAGTRRLYARGVEVLLDVILGLPADDEAGVAETLDFIERERLGAYDAFTLQVLPGTAVRREASTYAMAFQDRPPYYVLATDRLAYADLRRLRRDLKLRAGLEPDAVEGCPEPCLDALGPWAIGDQVVPCSDSGQPLATDRLIGRVDLRGHAGLPEVDRLAAHVDLIADMAVPGGAQPLVSEWIAAAIAANPATLFDLYLVGDRAPAPEQLRAWRAALPFTPGYLDRVAVYRRATPAPEFDRVSPRIWLVLPWTAQAEPWAYEGVAELIWEYGLGADETPPLAAWERAGGAGIWVRGASAEALRAIRAGVAVPVWGE
jgi:hypothetical protein